MISALKKAQVGSEIYYPVPMHLQECFVGRCRTSGSLCESEKASLEVLALPIYPELTKEMLAHVAASLMQVVSANSTLVYTQ